MRKSRYPGPSLFFFQEPSSMRPLLGMLDTHIRTGLEYANMFAKLGAKVVVVEFMENILQMLDCDLKDFICC